MNNNLYLFNLLCLSAFLLLFIFFIDHKSVFIDNHAFASELSQGSLDKISEFEKWNCGINNEVNSNHYVKEFRIPEICSIPISIAFDEKENKVWFVGTRNGTLFEYNPINQEFISYKIPKWFSRDLPAGSSWSWDLKTDVSGNTIWFTDEKLNSIWSFDKNKKKFAQFTIPFHSTLYSTSYPVSFELVDEKNLYLVGIRSLSLWHGAIDKMVNGTSLGIEEIPIPLKKIFKGIPEYEIGLGSLAIDNDKKNIWITALAFDKKGAVIKYDTEGKKFYLYELPDSFRSPTGITIDSDNHIWITDHATSSFYKVQPPKESRKLTSLDMEHFVTSPLSSRIYGIGFGNISSKSINLYENSLPYWIKDAPDGTIWTNEHVGNRIAKFLPVNDTMIEYWLPSQNSIYSGCNPDDTNIKCGYSNVLNFDLESKVLPNLSSQISKAWFTEQSENKIGFIDLEKEIPISLTTTPNFLNIKNENNNETIELQMNVNVEQTGVDSIYTQSLLSSNSSIILKPVISSTLSSNGNLNGLEVTFSPEILQIKLDKINNKSNNIINITIKPIQYITPGKYNLMVGVESHDYTITKKVKLNVD